MWKQRPAATISLTESSHTHKTSPSQKKWKSKLVKASTSNGPMVSTCGPGLAYFCIPKNIQYCCPPQHNTRMLIAFVPKCKCSCSDSPHFELTEKWNRFFLTFVLPFARLVVSRGSAVPLHNLFIRVLVTFGYHLLQIRINIQLICRANSHFEKNKI